MAKPIRATPVLKGKDAEIFVKNLIKEGSKPSNKRVKVINTALSVNFKIC